jgi:hypothetical protein
VQPAALPRPEIVEIPAPIETPRQISRTPYEREDDEPLHMPEAREAPQGPQGAGPTGVPLDNAATATPEVVGVQSTPPGRSNPQPAAGPSTAASAPRGPLATLLPTTGDPTLDAGALGLLFLGLVSSLFVMLGHALKRLAVAEPPAD